MQTTYKDLKPQGALGIGYHAVCGLQTTYKDLKQGGIGRAGRDEAVFADYLQGFETGPARSRPRGVPGLQTTYKDLKPPIVPAAGN